MRLEGFHPIQHLAAIHDFANDLNLMLLHQEAAEPFPEDGMSVSNEYCDRIHSANYSALFCKGRMPTIACRDNSLRINAS
jgi:hypothetical protein